MLLLILLFYLNVLRASGEGRHHSKILIAEIYYGTYGA
jgi:hypothetical protein